MKTTPPITLGELKEIIDSIIETTPGSEDFSLYVPNDKDSTDRVSATRIITLTEGVDWDSGKIFFIPENVLSEVPKKMPITRS